MSTAIELERFRAESEELRRKLCKALIISPDTDWPAVIADARSAGVVRDAEYRWCDRVSEETERLHGQLNNCIDALRGVVLAEEWTPRDRERVAEAVRRARVVYESRGRQSGGER